MFISGRFADDWLYPTNCMCLFSRCAILDRLYRRLKGEYHSDTFFSSFPSLFLITFPSYNFTKRITKGPDT